MSSSSARSAGLDDQGDVLVLVDLELLDSALDVVAVDRSRERRRLELLLHRLRLHALDSGGAHESTGGDEARELVDSVEGLRHAGLPGHAHEVGVPGDCLDHLLRVAALLHLLDRVAGVARVEVRVTLVIEVMDEARDRVGLLVLAPLAGVGAHGRLDAEQVLAQRLGLDPLGDQLPCIVS